MDATTQIPSDRRRGEPPVFRPFSFVHGPNFMHEAKCRNDHAIGEQAAWIEDQADVHYCHKQHRGQQCNQWTWIYRFRGPTAVVVPIRWTEIEPLRKARTPGDAFAFLGILEQSMKLWLWLNVA